MKSWRIIDFRLLREPERVTAAHESGHAVAMWASPFVIEITCLTIVPEKDNAGSVAHSSGLCRLWQRPYWLFDQAVISLAGLAAEIETSGKAGTKAGATDIRKAVAACQTLAEWERNGGRAWRLPYYNDIKPFRLESYLRPPPDERTTELLATASQCARSRLRQFEDEFWRVYRAALKKRTLDHRDLNRVLGPRPWMPWGWHEMEGSVP